MTDLERFENILKFTLKSEGGYSNDPDDPGKATNKGITQKTYDDYRVDYKQLPVNDVKDITDAEVSEIYHELYWSIANCEMLSTPIAEVVFDTAVNCGVVTAKKMLQRAVGVTDDGSIGKYTLAHITDKNALMVADLVLDQRRDYYDKIMLKNPKLEKYRKGWFKRIDELKSYLTA